MNLTKYAEVLIFAMKAARAGKFKKGDNIWLRYDAPAENLADEIYAKLIEQGFNVYPTANPTENMQKSFYARSSAKQLKNIFPWSKVFHENINGMIGLFAPQNLTNLKDCDPKRLSAAALAKKQLRDIQDKMEEKGLFSWTLANFPTEGMAKQAGASFKTYEEQIIKACFLNEENPVKKFKEVFLQIKELCRRLSALPIKTLRAQSKNMDLEILLGRKRRFIGGGGCNVPSFEIFTSPDWRGTKGVYYSDLPSFRSGNIVKGIKLEFKSGRVIRASARQGENFLKKMLAMDAGAAQIGEFSLTDISFSKIDRYMADTLYDENFGGKYGNCHIALGNSYSDTYGENMSELSETVKKQLGFNQSALHWDLINTQDKLVTAKFKNGKSLTIYEKGRFTI